jgi:ribosome recycling factor
MLDSLKQELNSRMDKALKSFEAELKTVRTGRASPGLLEHINIEAYGNVMPLNQIASVNIQDSKMLSVQVWDKEMVKNVEKAINDSDLGVSASSDGQLVRVPMPPLSEERRKELVKVISRYAEQAKVAIRNIRRDGIEQLRKFEKDSQISKDELHKDSEAIQKLTDQHIKEVDASLESREKEIMHV